MFHILYVCFVYFDLCLMMQHYVSLFTPSFLMLCCFVCVYDTQNQSVLKTRSETHIQNVLHTCPEITNPNYIVISNMS